MPTLVFLSLKHTGWLSPALRGSTSAKRCRNKVPHLHWYSHKIAWDRKHTTAAHIGLRWMLGLAKIPLGFSGGIKHSVTKPCSTRNPAGHVPGWVQMADFCGLRPAVAAWLGSSFLCCPCPTPFGGPWKRGVNGLGGGENRTLIWQLSTYHRNLCWARQIPSKGCWYHVSYLFISNHFFPFT